jgi:hypothetical protein
MERVEDWELRRFTDIDLRAPAEGRPAKPVPAGTSELSIFTTGN